MDLSIRIFLAAILFGSVGFITGRATSQTNSEDFDCVNDYSGAIVVEKKDGILTVSKDGCNYETVRFPALYDYSLGDTICKSSTVFTETEKKVRQEIKEELEYKAMIKRIRDEY